jgi:hypothetical protein
LIGADCNALISSCFDFGFWILDNITSPPAHLTQRNQAARIRHRNGFETPFDRIGTDRLAAIANPSKPNFPLAADRSDQIADLGSTAAQIVQGRSWSSDQRGLTSSFCHWRGRLHRIGVL